MDQLMDQVKVAQDAFGEQLKLAPEYLKTAQDAFGEWLTSLDARSWTIIGIAAAALIALSLIVRAARRSAQVRNRLQEMEATMAQQLKQIEDQAKDQAGKHQEELQKNLRDINDSVTKAVSEMTRTQQSQLDSFAGQLRDVNGRGEQRLDGIQRTVEQRLVQYQDRMDRVGDVLDNKLTAGDQQLDKFREVMERLSSIERTVDDRLNTTLDRQLNESFKLMSDRLDRVYAGLGEMQTLASGLGDLKRVLSNAHAKGIVGEIQLSTLLAQLMMPDQYRERVRIKPNSEDVSFAIVLPGKTSTDPESLMPIDASFPGSLYEQLMEAIDDGNKQSAKNIEGQLVTAIRDAARHMSEQFISPPTTTDFAVLFLASEGMYAEIIRIPGLQQQIQAEYRVMVAGPTTLGALLNSLQMGMKTIAIERRSEEVWGLLSAVQQEIGTFADALNRTQKRIRQAGESIEDAAEKSRIIQNKLRDVNRDSILAPQPAITDDDGDATGE